MSNLVKTHIHKNNFEEKVLKALVFGLCNCGNIEYYIDYHSSNMILDFEKPEDAAAFVLQDLEKEYNNIIHPEKYEKLQSEINQVQKDQLERLRTIITQNNISNNRIYKGYTSKE